MANNFQPNPHVVDTAMDTTLLATTPRRPAQGPLYLISIYWETPASAGDTFVIEDAAGNVIKQGKCEADGQSQEFDLHGIAVGDYKVTTLDSGTLFIQRHANGQLKAS